MKDDISGNAKPAKTGASNRNTQYTGNSGLTDVNNPFTYAGAQFYNLQAAAEPDPGRVNTYDNPSFLWPNNYYYNTSGNKVDIHRGYMRSLITDPNIAPSYGGTGDTPNRRLFFQFNPQVLTRSVSQSVGTMNPLLQDPAQLSQPIPGTASFGFELFFNREQEVNNNSTEGRGGTSLPDLPSLSGGTQPVAAELGVMADIMILDSIIGQGISSDLVNIIQGYTDSQAKMLEQQDKAAYDSQTGAYATEESRKNYKQLQIDTSNLQTQINANLGNSAFLNPLPVRVIFSSMFMVEGLVTSAEVTFTKFSANMVPTQCRVALNMYALYIGFAKKDTFLHKNLTDSATQQKKENKANAVTQKQLDVGFHAITYSGRATYSSTPNKPKFSFSFNFDRTDEFKKLTRGKDIQDVSAQFYLEYKFAETNTATVTDKEYTDSRITLATGGGETSVIESKLIDGIDLFSSDLDAAATTAIGDNKYYLSYRIIVELSARGDYDVFSSTPDTLIIQEHVDYRKSYNTITGIGSIVWNNPRIKK